MIYPYLCTRFFLYHIEQYLEMVGAFADHLVDLNKMVSSAQILPFVRAV